jgi:hypothetical protein
MGLVGSGDGPGRADPGIWPPRLRPVATGRGRRRTRRRILGREPHDPNKRPTAFYLFKGYTGVAEVHLERMAAGDRSPATKQAARQACAALHTFARIFPIGKPRDQLLNGLVLHLSDRPRRARAAWRASLSTAQRLGMPLDAALAHARLGLSATGTPQGQWHLEQARTLLHQLGIPDDLTRVQTPAERTPQR